MNSAGAKFESSAHLKDELVRRILAAGQPSAIILFGSEARGQASDGSDLDILIIERENPLPRHLRASGYREALLDLVRTLGRDIDILVYTPPEIEEWANVPNAFVTTALREGKILYEDAGGFISRLVCKG